MYIKYCGPALDYSGYGEANRHDIGALTVVGFDVVGEYTRHCLEIGEFGDLGKLVMECSKKTGDYKIKILHTTPNIYGQFIEPEKYHIGRVFWETDKLPPQFARGVQMLQEVWTGSEFNAEAIRKSGVTNIPIKIIPEAIKLPDKQAEPFIIPNKSDYKFYSIFEWTERKNPRALLTAFLTEFENDDNVSLTIKTYVDNFCLEKQRQIRDMVATIKRGLGLKRYAPIYLFTNMFTRDEVYRFHSSFDCFVSSHRGEGWGIPQMEAMASSKTVISTNIGGIHEYIGDAAKLVPYKMVTVENNRNSEWYQSDQNWGEVDILKLREAMRDCYQNQQKARLLGDKGREFVKNNFSLEAVGKLMKDRIEELSI